MPAIKVKGKTGELAIYALINFKDAAGPKSLTEVRRILGIPKPDANVDVDSEEKKYEILEK